MTAWYRVSYIYEQPQMTYLYNKTIFIPLLSRIFQEWQSLSVNLFWLLTFCEKRITTWFLRKQLTQSNFLESESCCDNQSVNIFPICCWKNGTKARTRSQFSDLPFQGRYWENQELGFAISWPRNWRQFVWSVDKRGKPSRAHCSWPSWKLQTHQRQLLPRCWIPPASWWAAYHTIYALPYWRVALSPLYEAVPSQRRGREYRGAKLPARHVRLSANDRQHRVRIDRNYLAVQVSRADPYLLSGWEGCDTWWWQSFQKWGEDTTFYWAWCRRSAAASETA